MGASIYRAYQERGCAGRVATKTDGIVSVRRCSSKEVEAQLAVIEQLKSSLDLEVPAPPLSKVKDVERELDSGNRPVPLEGSVFLKPGDKLLCIDSILEEEEELSIEQDAATWLKGVNRTASNFEFRLMTIAALS